jgi:hypothetical protein
MFLVPSPNSTPFKLPGDFVDWLTQKRVRVLNVAGNRESSAPGIGQWVEAYLADVFRLLKQEAAR